MPSILTKLCKKLSGKTMVDMVPEDFTFDLFPDLFKTTTLRIVANLDFCRFGREQFALSGGHTVGGFTMLDEDGEVCESLLAPQSEVMAIKSDGGVSIHNLTEEVIRYDNFPPSCSAIVNGAFWFELEDLKGETSSKNGLAIYKNPSRGVCRFICYDRRGRLGSRPLSDDNERTLEALMKIRGELFGAAFVLNEMPSACFRQKSKELEIPFNLKDEASKSKKPLFTTVYLHKEVSDVLGNGGEQKTLDISGRRFHFVRGHWMVPAGKTEPTWRKFHWRGDVELGVVRKVYKAA